MPDNLSEWRVLTDLVSACSKLCDSGKIVAAYLYGSVLEALPVIYWAQDEPVILSDIDLLLVAPARAFDSEVIKNSLENSRVPEWGVFHDIHIGVRIRSIFSLRRTVAEFASWGQDLKKSSLLVGVDVLKSFPMEDVVGATWRLLPRNVVSKLWFTLYSLPVTPRVGGRDAIILQKRLSSAAKRIALLAVQCEYPDSFQSLELRKDVAPFPHSLLLKADLERLASEVGRPSAIVDWIDIKSRLLVICDATEVALERWAKLDSGSSLISAGEDLWMRVILNLARFFVDERGDFCCCGQVRAILSDVPELARWIGALSSSGQQDLSQVIRKVHISQMPIISPNLL